MLRISGVALLAFSFFATIQFLSLGCMSSVPLAPLSCYLGVEPNLIPYLLGTGAGILLVGVVSDPEARRAEVTRIPPGLGFVLLGGAVLEIAMTYVHAFGTWALSPLAPPLLAAGILLLARGGLDWWNSHATGEASRPEASATDAKRAGESRETTPQPAGGRWTSLADPLGVLLAAFGAIALVVGLLSKDGCVSIPDAYLCYDPGLEPSMSLPFLVAGGALLLSTTILNRGPSWRGFPSPGWNVAFLVLAGGVLEVAVALYLYGDHSSGWTAAVYAPTLATAGGLMAARGASTPSPRRSAPHRLAILGIAGLLLEIGFVWFFVSVARRAFGSSALWATYVGVWIPVEAASVGLAYGVLFSCAFVLRRWHLRTPATGLEPEPASGRRRFLLLIAADAVIFGTIVGWLFFVGIDWTMSPLPVLGVSVHAVPFAAILLQLGSPSQPAERSVPA